MGNQAFKQRKDIEKDYQLEGFLKDNYMGDCIILVRQRNHIKLLKKDIDVDDIGKLSELQKLLERGRESNSNILYPRELAGNQNMVCSSYNVYSIYFQWTGMTLAQLIHQKRQQINQFNEQLVWFILNDLSRALEHLADRQSAHWDIRPENIYINSHQNYFIYDPTCFTRKPEQIVNRRISESRMNKQVLRLLEDGQYGVEAGINQDMRDLALTIVQIMSMKSMKQIKLEQQLENMKNKYSRQLRKLVGQMGNTHNTMPISSLRKYLRNHEEDIVRFQKFYDEPSQSSVGWIPEKRKQQMKNVRSPNRQKISISALSSRRQTMLSPRHDMTEHVKIIDHDYRSPRSRPAVFVSPVSRIIRYDYIYRN